MTIWDEMRELKKDWDSYGGDPPNEHAIMRAKEFVETIVGETGPEGFGFQVAPSVEGGVGVTVGNFYFEFCNEADEEGVDMIGVRMFKREKDDTTNEG